MEEVWKNIDGYGYNYQVSSLGNIRSLYNNKGNFRIKLLKKQEDKDGYLRAFIYKNGKPSPKFIHRLVAEAFIPNPNSYPCINHKDENKQNNCIDNLEWCTIYYNNMYNDRNLRIGKVNTNNPKRCKRVIQYTLEGKLIKEYNSLKEASKETNIDAASIAKVCKGFYIHYGKVINSNTAGGYKWKWKNL